MTDSNSERDLRITNSGFQFLLQDTYTQFWQLLIQYTETDEQRGTDLVTVLQFCFFIGSLEFGRAFSAEGFTAKQLEILHDFRDIGLVYHRKKSSPLFYPTRFASLLNVNRSGQQFSLVREEDSFIVIETNYRVYAYTSTFSMFL